MIARIDNDGHIEGYYMAKKEEVTDLATISDVQGVLDRPKSLDRNDRSGTEDISPDEIQLPRLAVAQGLSPQLVPDDPQYIRGLVIGQMFNDVSEDIYGNGPAVVVPVKRQVKRIEFDPNDRKVPIDRNVPPGDPRLEWDGDNPPRATEFVEYICLLLQKGKIPEGVVVSIKTTNKEMRRAAKLWNTYVLQRQAPIYSGLYNLTSKVIRGQNKDGQQTMYGVFVVKNAGFIPKDTPVGAALYDYAKQFHESLKDKVVETDREGHDEGAADTDFDPAAMETENSEM